MFARIRNVLGRDDTLGLIHSARRRSPGLCHIIRASEQVVAATPHNLTEIVSVLRGSSTRDHRRAGTRTEPRRRLAAPTQPAERAGPRQRRPAPEAFWRMSFQCRMVYPFFFATHAVSSPGIEPGLRPSQSRVQSGTLRGHVISQAPRRGIEPRLADSKSAVQSGTLAGQRGQPLASPFASPWRRARATSYRVLPSSSPIFNIRPQAQVDAGVGVAGQFPQRLQFGQP